MAVTSTVLDVTVLLLCVSASVVALGASDVGGPDGPTAADAADRLVTETAAVSYSDEGAPNGTRRAHSTRAELLALVAVRDADGAFDREAVEAVRAGVGPRTRVDVTVRRGGESDADDTVAATGGGGSHGAPGAPRTRGGAAASPHSIAGEAVPVGGVDGRGGRDRADDTSDAGVAVAVGPEPPRNADVGVAVVRQPVPDRFDGDRGERRSSGGVVRIVVRRW
ncbi:hypothetical protein GLW36_11600 [Halorubrum terrestre]|uniref:Uncharacterized protein n=1 Tax=Halorubrum distributum TaxID=29283 RepID=A0A6B1I8Y9_9EURY|nr:hypothetical protein [Halorubrum terrestre]MYL17282.1 hypothetical protein [Halorubrum terrestre]